MRAVSDQVYRAEQTDRQCSASEADRNRPRPTSREVALEAELIEAKAQLRARDEFLAVAAHELRNPMTPIAAWVELLMTQARRRPGQIPSEMLRGLERLEYLVDAYIRRATTLLDVSRISTGHLQLSPGKIDLSSLVRETMSAMIPAAQTAGCAISLAVQDEVSGSFDRTAIEQVIDNIVSNAIRYGAGQPIHVVLTANGNTVRLAVSDQGIGISDSDQARIFGQFQRVEGNTTGGFGVGLWITRQLVLAMEGNISVTSKPGAGSTFTVALPLKTD
jgi:signal transduction histidine kinase